MHMTRKKLDFELGRYKRKVEDQQKEIRQLKEQIAGYENSQDGMFAMMAAIVEQAGEVTIAQKRINEILEENRQTIVQWDQEQMTYTLRMPGGEMDVEKEDEQPTCEQG